MRKYWPLLLATAFAGLAFLAGVLGSGTVKRLLPEDIRMQLRTATEDQKPTRVANTQLYNVTLDYEETPAKGRYGAIDAVGQRLVLANRYGTVWVRDGDGGAFREATLKIPTNAEAFEASQQIDDILAHNPGWADRTRDLVGVKDILVQRMHDGVRLYASYHHWYPERACLALRIGYADAWLDSTDAPAWQDLYETSPCLTLADGGNHVMADEAGGRMALADDDRLIFTVGDHGRMGIPGGPVYAQDPDASYGKLIELNTSSGEARTLSMGHRNPQGIAIAPDGTIYASEHGPNGGDELNAILPDGNYGWPEVSYGRACSTTFSCSSEDLLHNLDYPIHRNLGQHLNFTRPVFSWVPSIGISSIAVVDGGPFAHWQGDVLVTSLRAKELIRLRLREGRAVYAEPIADIGRRIRDIVRLDDGRFVLKLDRTGQIVTISPNASRTDALVATCAACHAFTPEQSSGLGPNLVGIMGRTIADDDGFDYSDALIGADGEWDRDRLATYLADPQTAFPGTSMPATQLAQDDIAALLEFLETL